MAVVYEGDLIIHYRCNGWIGRDHEAMPEFKPGLPVCMKCGKRGWLDSVLDVWGTSLWQRSCATQRLMNDGKLPDILIFEGFDDPHGGSPSLEDYYHRNYKHIWANCPPLGTRIADSELPRVAPPASEKGSWEYEQRPNRQE